MEGMVSLEAMAIQSDCAALGGCKISLDIWTKGLATKLLEATHGQWLYINMLVHNIVSGLKAAERKVELQMAIENQIVLSGAGLHEQDRYLLEINLED